jgi:hypothetical protein
LADASRFRVVDFPRETPSGTQIAVEVLRVLASAWHKSDAGEQTVSKKHFIALAKYLRDTEGYCEAFTPAQLEHLANFCHAQNCNFKRERWLDYIAGKCGKNGGAR